MSRLFIGIEFPQENHVCTISITDVDRESRRLVPFGLLSVSVRGHVSPPTIDGREYQGVIELCA